MSEARPVASVRTSQLSPPPLATPPPARRYLPPFIYRSSPSSSHSASPQSNSPSSLSSSRSLSRHSPASSPRSLRSAGSVDSTAAAGMTKGKHSEHGSTGRRSPAPAATPATQTPTKQPAEQLIVPSSASTAPASPDVLTPASTKSIIPKRNSNTLNTPSKQPPLSTPQPKTPAVINGGQAVKRTVEQLSGGSGTSGAWSGKRPSVSQIVAGTVAQRAADYTAAVAADEQQPPSSPLDMPPAVFGVGELVEHFSPNNTTAPSMQRTQHHRTPVTTQRVSKAYSDAAHGSKDSAAGGQQSSPEVEVGDVRLTSADEVIGKLHPHTAIVSEPSLATEAATADVQPLLSAVNESATVPEASSSSPRPIQLTNKQRRSQARPVQPLVEQAAIAPPHNAHSQQLTERSPGTATPSHESLTSPPQTLHIGADPLRLLWRAVLWSVWAALLLSALDLFFREPNWESATLSALAATALVANALSALSSDPPTASSGSIGLAVLHGVPAIAASTLPFLFAQRLAARSTLFWLFCAHPGLLLLCLALPLVCVTVVALCGGGRVERGSVGLLSSLSSHLHSTAFLLCFAFSLALLHSSTTALAVPYSTPWPPLASQPAQHVRLVVLLQAASVVSWLLTSDKSQLGRVMTVLALALTEQHLRLPRVDCTHT